MLASGTSTAPMVADGFVESIDLVSRTVTVQMDMGLLIVDVPPACEILLNGERVKLRLLQPRDRINITFCRKRGVLSALSLKVTTRR